MFLPRVKTFSVMLVPLRFFLKLRLLQLKLTRSKRKPKKLRRKSMRSVSSINQSQRELQVFSSVFKTWLILILCISTHCLSSSHCSSHQSVLLPKMMTPTNVLTTSTKSSLNPYIGTSAALSSKKTRWFSLSCYAQDSYQTWSKKSSHSCWQEVCLWEKTMVNLPPNGSTWRCGERSIERSSFWKASKVLLSILRMNFITTSLCMKLSNQRTSSSRKTQRSSLVALKNWSSQGWSDLTNLYLQFLSLLWRTWVTTSSILLCSTLSLCLQIPLVLLHLSSCFLLVQIPWTLLSPSRNRRRRRIWTLCLWVRDKVRRQNALSRNRWRMETGFVCRTAI